MDADDFKPKRGPTSEDDALASMVDIAMLRFYRSNQMTEDYDDPDITARLLHEKENDLELAARIGKALLQRNGDLQRRNETLEEQMGQANDRVTQLKHELQRKSDLLRVFTEDNGDTNDLKRSSERATCGHLKKRVRLLEEENAVLKADITQLKAMTIVLKEKEDQIVAEFLKKIAEAKRHTKILCNELKEKQDECDTRENKIRCLSKEISEKSKHEQNLKEENELLASKLRVLQGLQEDLAQELADLQERYAEVVAMLTGAKQDLKESLEREAESRFSAGSLPDDSLYDSLASEMETSDSGYSFNATNGRPSTGNCESGKHEENATGAIDTSDKKTNSLPSQADDLELRRLYATEARVTADEAVFDPVESDTEASERAKGIIRSIEAALAMPVLSTGVKCKYATRLGVPGTPGSKDLEFAIERLSHKSGPETNSLEAHTPENWSDRLNDATDHPGVSIQNNISVQPKKSIPNRAKLMLVVPVEGSRALAHWKQLATPSGIDPRSWEKLPGINVKSDLGISTSRKLPGPRKHYTVSSIFANAHLPTPVSVRPKSETGSLLPLLCSSSMVVGQNQVYPDIGTANGQHESTKLGHSLTKQCAGFLNSWLASANQAPIDKSQSWIAVLSGMDEKRSGVTLDHTAEHGLLNSVSDNADEPHLGSGVVMRTGMKVSKK